MILYKAIEKYNSSEDSWEEYKSWIKLPQLSEVISLDSMLNSCAFEIDLDDTNEFQYLYLESNVIRGDIYKSLDFVKSKAKESLKPYHILAIEKEPKTSCKTKQLKGFTFLGYDLLDKDFIASALTNCGGFYETYSPESLNEFGLLTDFNTVYQIREQLFKNNPYEDHADCYVWAIWKEMETTA